MLLAAQITGGLDHRLALVLYLLLLLAAACSVVMAWWRVLPAEREPFAAPGETQQAERDGFAIFLLANISVSLLLRIPGVDSGALAGYLAEWLRSDWANHIVMVGFIWFGFIPGLAAAYALIRSNPLRWPLAIGGSLTLGLWLSAPFLLAAIRGSE
jgi:hypothetical protein